MNLPNMPRYIRQLPDGSWLGAPGEHGPWRSIPAPQSGLPWPVPPATEESSAPQPVPATLSPAAQAVLDAFRAVPDLRDCPSLAAALRALAVQDETLFDGDEELMPAVRAVRTDRILAIAAELEGAND